MKPEMVAALRIRWNHMRLFRTRGSILTDYRILRNFIRINDLSA